MESLHGSKKHTMGRRKIEIKKIQKKTSLQVTFTKRRTGLFKKAGELSVLCGSEVAIIVQSPANKVHAFGIPSVEYVLHKFDTGAGFITNYTGLGDDARSEYEKADRILEEKKMEKISAMNHGIKENEFWWDQQTEGMELRELEEHLESLEDLRKKISCRIEEMEKLRTDSSPSTMEDTFGGLPVDQNNDNQELEKLVEVDIGDADDDAQMKKDDDGARGYSNLGTNMSYSLDFDDLLFTSNYGNSSTFNDLEAFLRGF